MAERNWRKDWELCENAAPGPWEAVLLDDFSDATYVIGWDADGFECCEFVNGLSLRGDHTDAQRQEQIHNTARFIAEARTALPYWLQRVKELEERVKVLEGRRCETCRWWEFDGRSPGNWGHCRKVEGCRELDWVRLDNTCQFAVWDHWGWPCGLVTRADFGCLGWERGDGAVYVELLRDGSQGRR